MHGTNLGFAMVELPPHRPNSHVRQQLVFVSVHGRGFENGCVGESLPHPSLSFCFAPVKGRRGIMRRVEM